MTRQIRSAGKGTRTTKKKTKSSGKKAKGYK